MSNIDAPQQNQLFPENSWWLKATLFILFLLAALIRRDEIRAAGHLLDREFTAAIFSRAYYFTNNDAIEDWRRDIAVTTKNQQPVLEPPLLEYLVSLIYRVIDREEMYYARYLTNAFWLISGVFMYLIAKRLLSTDEAVIATTYYLFVPMGIIISRSFQPDSLMMMMFLISLYALILYFEQPSTKRLVLAGLLSSVTLLLRPLVIFAIFCSFLAFSIHRNRSWKKVIDPPLVIYGIVSLLPTIAYYGYGILFAGFMRWKVSTSFMPFLLVKRDFWLGWINNVVDVAEFSPLILAIIGFFLIRNSKAQYWITGLIVSFLLFSVAFTYHIHTHPYYHIQLFPIVALCMSPTTVLIVKSLKNALEKYWRIPALGIFLLSLFITHQEVRGSLYRERHEAPKVAYEIGEAVHHSPHVVYVSFYYGLPLEYYGEFGGAPWPVSIEHEFYRRPGEQALSVQERLNGLGFTPEYFVISNFELYDLLHGDLKEYLQKNCSLLVKKEKYLVYTSCNLDVSE
jgi:hypothetical protein